MGKLHIYVAVVGNIIFWYEYFPTVVPSGMMIEY